MRLSKRGEYGLRAMIQLAHPAPDGALLVLQINEISAMEKMPVKFLEQILLTLKNSGLLQSRRGISGGYYLAKPASEIMLGQIVYGGDLVHPDGWDMRGWPGRGDSRRMLFDLAVKAVLKF